MAERSPDNGRGRPPDQESGPDTQQHTAQNGIADARVMLPVVSRCPSGRHGLQVAYWAWPVACPCCKEPKPCRWVDFWHGDFGWCFACDRARVPAWRANGRRCSLHRRWDAEQAALAAEEPGRLQVGGPGR
jgi:hypothetical protein